MTRREFLNAVIAEVENAELKEFAKNEIAELDRKNANRKPTKAQLENEKLKGEIMAKVKGEFNANAVAEMFELTRAKASSLLTALEKDGKITSVLTKEGKSVHKVYTVK